MLGIKLICTGKLKERFYIDAEREYNKRLAGYCKAEIIEISEQRLSAKPSDKEILAALEKEAADIELKIPPGAYLAALCIEGRELDSQGVAELLRNCALGGQQRICFVIGGSFGLHEKIKSRADLRLSMSKLTFPHNLARIMLLEQLYRGFKIIEGGKYHK